MLMNTPVCERQRICWKRHGWRVRPIELLLVLAAATSGPDAFESMIEVGDVN